jgi:hypothetical protein
VLARRCVSVTPLKLNLTDEAFARSLGNVLKDRAPV